MSTPVNENKKRPVNLDLQTMQMPIASIASILHRISGVIMFIAIGILLWLLSLSLSSAEGFNQAASLVDSFFVKFVLWGILSALGYHICGGVRHMLMDSGRFESLEEGALTAKVAFGVAIVFSLLAGILVW